MRMKVARTPMLLIAGPFVFCITSCVNVFAQESDADLENRVFNLGILRAGKSNSKSAKKNVDPKVLLAQVQEDFTAIQVTNNELAEVLERKDPLDLNVVAKSVTEIRMRAVRLMENLTELKMKNRLSLAVRKFALVRKSAKSFVYVRSHRLGLIITSAIQTHTKT
ncbi:MAG TPA: hypothetical protein VFP64_07510 [Pyrinomonadaceae bacterium]|nr:hypothetical protein [Pyrinomonadaceae bacterium]